MWSLPNIVRLNEQAARDAKQNLFEKEVAHPGEHHCEVCEWSGEETPADYAYLWYDIFSNDPKGSIFLCERHDGYTGSPMEGYFTCGECEKIFIENYTWERYAVVVDCEELCLPCALKRYLSDEKHWVSPEEVQAVVLDPKSRVPEDEWNDGGWNRVFDPGSGILNLASCPHLIGVEMPIPPEITFITNLEFDSCTGEMLAGYSSTYPPGVGERAALESIRSLADEGYSRFLPILDAAYQFSISFGLYVKSAEYHKVLSGTVLQHTGGALDETEQWAA